MNIHPSFRLNGQQFKNSNDLIAYAKVLEDEVYLFLTNWFNESQYIYVKTSGSTGAPKTIHLPKLSMQNSAKATGAYFSLFDKTTALLCMSSQYIAGKMMLVRALSLGWELDVVAPASNPLKQIYKNYDFCAMVPMQVASSLNDLHKVKKLIVGGGSLSDSYLKEIQHLTTEVYATYGMTETCTHIAVQKLNNQPTEFYECLPNIKLNKDKRGCLVINAPKISKEPIETNDLIELISDTKFKWLGRIDHVINSGGLKLLPEVIESKIAPCMEFPFFIAAQKDAKLGEKVILVIESKPYNQQKINKLNSLLQTVLSKFEMPKSIYFTDTFFKTDTKKIQRQQTLDLIFKS